MYPDNSARTGLKVRRAAKRSISLLLSALFAAALVLPCAAAGLESEYKIFLNGVQLTTDEDLVMRNLLLFMPLDNSALSALGATLALTPCPGKECFSVTAMGKEISFTLEENPMSVEGRTFDAGAAPFREQGVIYLPAQIFFETLGMDAIWDEEKGILAVDTVFQQPSAINNLYDLYGLGQKPSEPTAPAPQETQETPQAGQFGVTTPRMAYTYENQIKILSVRVGGDKARSRTEEKGDVYDIFNIRFLGTLDNGYEFQSVFRTSMTTNTENKRGEVKKLELSMNKNKISLQAYDIQPKFSRFVFRNYPLQGINYRREGKHFTLSGAAGKAMKRLKSSNYTRYIGGLRIERAYKTPRPLTLGAGFARVRDTGGYVDMKKLDNITYSVDLDADLKKPWNLKGEFAHSQIEFFRLNSSRNGNARTLVLTYTSKRVSWKTNYTRVGSDFYSETSYFSRGRGEFSSLYNKKINPRTTAGVGYRLKRIGGKETYIYPVNIRTQPFQNRKYLTFTALRNFEKTTSPYLRIQDAREIKVSDKIGTNRVDFNYERRKQKTDDKHIYRNKYGLTVKSDLSDKLTSEFKYKKERWYHDRQSITRQTDLNLNYEVAPWAEIVLGWGRYYNTPKSARTTMRIGFQKLDITKDREFRVMYQFHNYQEYNINSIEMSYSFFK